MLLWVTGELQEEQNTTATEIKQHHHQQQNRFHWIPPNYDRFVMRYDQVFYRWSTKCSYWSSPLGGKFRWLTWSLHRAIKNVYSRMSHWQGSIHILEICMWREHYINIQPSWFWFTANQTDLCIHGLGFLWRKTIYRLHPHLKIFLPSNTLRMH